MPSNPGCSPLALHLDLDAMQPLIEAVVRECLRQTAEAESRLPDKLAYSEAEAARLLSLQPHQLRDARLRGEITASRVMGGKIRYLKSDLLAYLMRDRANKKAS